MLGAREGNWWIRRGSHREHRGGKGHCPDQGRREEGVQEGPGWAGESSQV